jgi:GDPmannose 4,6-dehydratase
MNDGLCLHNYIHDIINSNKNFEILEIYNLAAQSHVGLSFKMPEYTCQVDGFGVLKILEIIRNLPIETRNKVKFYQAGTSELYGEVLETPQNEDTPFNPVSPYACAKQFAFNMTKLYREGYNMYCVNGILFNHESPRRGENFVTMKIINGIKNILNGSQEYIELGNIYSKRDWGHAKDYVYGMWLMMQQNGVPNDYVLSTGQTISVKEFIEKSFLYKGIELIWEGEGLQEIGKDKKTGKTHIKIHEKYYRPCEVDLLLGDCTKATRELRWTREYTNIDELIDSMFNEK